MKLFQTLLHYALFAIVIIQTAIEYILLYGIFNIRVSITYEVSEYLMETNPELYEFKLSTYLDYILMNKIAIVIFLVSNIVMLLAFKTANKSAFFRKVIFWMLIFFQITAAMILAWIFMRSQRVYRVRTVLRFIPQDGTSG